MNKYPTFKVVHKGNVNSDELDFKMYDELFGRKVVDSIYDDDDKSPSDFIIGDELYGRSIISITYLEEIINKLKSLGANYVSIDYNEDHPDFNFSGCLIDTASPEDIEIYFQVEEQKRSKEKQDKIDYLVAQLEKLKKE